MIEFNYKRSIFNICEMAFGTFKDIYDVRSDVAYMHSRDTQCLAPENCKIIIQKQYTLVHSLLCGEVDLLSRINKNCRYEIRRSEREGVEANIYDWRELLESNTVLDKFEETYNSVFRSKKLMNRFNRNLIEAAIRNGNLLVSVGIVANDPSCTVFHAYLIDGVNSVLIYSASPLWRNNSDKEKANLIGRINKYLHWNDMLWFKKHQYQTYEWGGISSCSNPNGIDRFKMEFGGQICNYYNYIVALTPLGYMYVSLIRNRSNIFDQSNN